MTFKYTLTVSTSLREGREGWLLKGSATVSRRKQAQIEAQLKELGMEGLEERLQSATQSPAQPPYKLARLISEVTQMQVRGAEGS